MRLPRPLTPLPEHRRELTGPLGAAVVWWAAATVVDSEHTLGPLLRLPKIQRPQRAQAMQWGAGANMAGHEDVTAFPDHLAVFVTHVPPEVSPEELELCFAACGEVGSGRRGAGVRVFTVALTLARLCACGGAQVVKAEVLNRPQARPDASVGEAGAMEVRVCRTYTAADAAAAGMAGARATGAV